jgi:allantoinase
MMPYEVRRDFIGYGANPPDPKWPNGARIAVNFVMNYEEGSEPSMQDGEGHTEIGLSDASRHGPVDPGPRPRRPKACSNMAAGSASGG